MGMTTAHPRLPLILAIVAAIVTLLLKSGASWLTGSVGLASDAAESLVNLIAAVTALVCLWYASQPVDPTHTYGHEKIEYFSSGLEAMLILVAAAGIAWYAIGRLITPLPLESLGVGTLVALAASLINLVVARLLLRVSRATESILLEASGQHLMADVWTSVGVVAGLGVVALTGWEVLDPILALAVAANIVWTAWGLLVRSFHGLMDHALPAKEQARLRTAIEGQLEPGLHFHALRTRQAGARRFADFHLLVPGSWSVQRAHDLTLAIEAALRGAFPSIEVQVHVEPVEEKAAWEDSALLPLEPSREPPSSSMPPSPTSN
jgi:cation diffusion facilitator family transporter